MQELNKKVIEWADNKGLLAKSSPLVQLTKTFEEVTELVTALVLKNPEEIKDAIGDINVTFIIFRELSEKMKDRQDLANSKLFHLINWVVEIFRNTALNKEVSIDISRAQEMLSKVAQENGLTLEECTQSAYDVISKRTGSIVNGIFVKDSPTPEIVERKDIVKSTSKIKGKGGQAK